LLVLVILDALLVFVRKLSLFAARTFLTAQSELFVTLIPALASS